MREIMMINSPLQRHMLPDSNGHVLSWCYIDQWGVSRIGIGDP